MSLVCDSADDTRPQKVLYCNDSQSWIVFVYHSPHELEDYLCMLKTLNTLKACAVQYINAIGN